MSNTKQRGENLDAGMSANGLEGYEWEGMGHPLDRALFEGSDPIKVTIGAGSNQKTWYLPEKVVTHCSPFFGAALNGNFAEAGSKAVDLPEDDPAAFEIWATWLSLGKCVDVFEEGYDEAYVRAWILGDKLVCPAFQDHVMSHFLDWCDNNAGDLWPEMIDVVYTESSPGCKLRQFLVEWFVWGKMHGYLLDYEDKIIASTELSEFLKDVLKAELRVNKDTITDPSRHRYRYYKNPAFEPGN